MRICLMRRQDSFSKPSREILTDHQQIVVTAENVRLTTKRWKVTTQRNAPFLFCCLSQDERKRNASTDVLITFKYMYLCRGYDQVS